jgi:spermidine synthase
MGGDEMADGSVTAIFRPYPLPPPPPGHYYVEPPDPEEAGSESLVTIEQSDPFDSYTYRLKRLLYQGHTPWQDVLIAETFNYGLALFLDGVIQSAADDEALYHELLVQPAMLRHPEPRDVLILGGGEGAALREVLAHRSVRSVTMVDLDRELVELCRTHLLSFHRGAFEDPRVHLVFADGRSFVEHDDGFYDVAVVDLVDLLDSGLADALYTRQFYQHLRRRLRPDAIVAVQGLEFSFLDDKAHAALARTLRTVFAEVYSWFTATARISLHFSPVGDSSLPRTGFARKIGRRRTSIAQSNIDWATGSII